MISSGSDLCEPAEQHRPEHRPEPVGVPGQKGKCSVLAKNGSRNTKQMQCLSLKRQQKHNAKAVS